MFSTPTGRVLFQITINHALVDGAAVNLLIRDWNLAYYGKLPKLNKPLYSKYISYLKSPSFTFATEYWKKYLLNVQETRIPVAQNNEARPWNWRSMQLTEMSDLHFGDFCRTQEITKATLIYAGWAMTLSHYLRTDSVSFGYIVSGRDLPPSVDPNIIGPVLHTLTCHTKICQAASISQILLQTIQEDSNESLPYQCLGMEDTLSIIGASRTLFNTEINFQKLLPDDSDYGVPELRFVPRRLDDPAYRDVRYNIFVSFFHFYADLLIV